MGIPTSHVREFASDSDIKSFLVIIPTSSIFKFNFRPAYWILNSFLATLLI